MTGSFPVPARPARGWKRIARLFEPPDEVLVDAGKQGEILIAKIRVSVVMILMLVPLASLAVDPAAERGQHVIGLMITALALLASTLLFFAAARDRRQSWLPLLTTVFDVSLVSFALLVYAYRVAPHEGVNSLVTFPTYFLALGATCLRFDPRISLIGGLVAMSQYLALVVLVTGTMDLTVDPAQPYTPFQWGDQISRLVLLGAATALNVYIVRGMQQQRLMSTSDPLTGIFNRRFFDDHLANEIQRAERYQRGFSVAMVDVDHFKRFNDTYGHAAGDRVLRTVARSLQRSIRRSDIVARYGGEEFVLIIRESESRQGVERVEQIRQSIEAGSFPISRQTMPARLTVSAGVATWPEDGRDADALMAKADERLFAAKNAGRNRVVGP